MNKKLTLFFPDSFTEAHRTPERQHDLRVCFEELGVTLRNSLVPSCDAVFCGTIWQSEQLKDCKLPVFHYCWDLYPWQLAGESNACWKNWLWHPYVDQLKTCAGIFVPGESTAKRIREIVGRDDAKVVKAPVKLWKSDKVYDGGYVVDVMRKYPDPNQRAVEDACKALGIQCVATGANLPWDNFRDIVSGARLLVSAYYEASTGGLTLLEGYALGKPVLLSDSPYNGAQEYFDCRGYTFHWDDPKNLRDSIWVMTTRPQSDFVPADCRQWVESTYNDQTFAFEIVSYLRSKL